MIVVYKKIPKKQIMQEAEEAISKVEAWFAANPKRKDCNVDVWYGQRIKVKPKTIRQQIEEARDKSINGDKENEKKQVASKPKKDKKSNA